MLQTEQSAGGPDVAVEIGGMPIRLRTDDAAFRALLEKRYAGFVRPAGDSFFALDVDVIHPERALSRAEELREKAQPLLLDEHLHVVYSTSIIVYAL